MKQIITHIFLLFALITTAQSKSVNWLSFEELEPAFIAQPKKVMIYFYADWCVYCKKMEKDVYSKQEIESLINDEYYAVKFNVESNDTIQFGGKTFINRNYGRKRQASHQIAELLATQEGQPMTLPAVVIMNKEFEIEQRHFRYISPKELFNILK